MAVAPFHALRLSAQAGRGFDPCLYPYEGIVCGSSDPSATPRAPAHPLSLAPTPMRPRAPTRTHAPAHPHLPARMAGSEREDEKRQIEAF